MARRSQEIDPTTPYHLSSRCINREWFALPMEQVWKITCLHLHATKHFYNLKILSYVLMSNHFHLIAQAPDGNLSHAMAFFLRETSRDLTKSSGRINQTWGGRFFRSRLGSYHYFMHAYKYLYQNPLRAGVTSDVMKYPYSTLPGLLGISRLEIPVDYDAVLFDNQTDLILKWLNQIPSQTHTEDVRKALRRGDFKFPKVSRINKPHPLEISLL